ncbi:F-box/WD repeat-containing protein 10 [Syngnathus scovelli]|uniref:F-box/WD repeat-containing protein 10 n=1 Tax=Syngnathus scovelli TaxID=161590 RepID=UPI0021106EAE|nr:F-box/WD repeat-containing protein 10 [Syngnathus scovelli]XP_049615237.1 F-box/WD repeat-containing protein 10 [Syngnathus scovelli]
MSESPSSPARQPACDNADEPCGMCPSCLFLVSRTNESSPRSLNLWKISDESRRSFIVGILLRCRSVPVLENIQNSLRLTSWDLLSYAPSKGNTLPELYARLDRKTRPAPLIREIWKWFNESPEWVQTRYLCLLLLRCDPELLSIAKNLISVVMTRLRRELDEQSCTSTQLNPASRDESKKDAFFPVLPVLPAISRFLFGLNRNRDFISKLPSDLSKRILGLLDETMLKRCMRVCKTWKQRAGETMEEIRFRKLYQEQVEAMMKRYKGVQMVNPSYARMVDVAVPAEEHESGKVKSTHMWPFESAYANIRTKTVRMEERNIYCGPYFTSVLIDTEDPHRVVDYKGGPMLSTASKDRAVRLLYVGAATKQVGLMKGHVGSIRVVLLCPERQLVITASCDTSIRCWSVRTDQCVLVLYGHSSMINCLDIHADRLVSGAKDCTAKVWSLQTEKHLEDFNFKHRSSVRCVKINATAVFSSCDRGVVKLWDAENASLLRVIDAHSSAVRCMFVDEWHLLSADTNGQVMAWSSRCETKGCLMTVSHPKEVKSLTLAYLRVVTGCVDGKIRIFNFLTGDCLRTIVVEAETTGRMLSLHFCENNILVNATSCVKLYQFAKVFWDYEEPADEASSASIKMPPPKLNPLSTSAKPKHVTTEEVTQKLKSLLQPLTPNISQRSRHVSQISSHRSEDSPPHCQRRRPLTSVRNPPRAVSQGFTTRLPQVIRNRATSRNTL